MNDDFDELDRALFALPLATPPADLRASILRATVFAPAAGIAATRLPLRGFEIGAIGVALAVAAWLVIATFANHAFAVAVGGGVDALLRAFADPTTLAWLAAGAAVALTPTLANLAIPARIARNDRP